MAQHQSSPYESYTSVIRQLLTAALSDEDFSIICFDHFSEVYQKFTTGMTFRQKVQLLIGHCARQNLFDKLLALVEELNPTQYAKFAASLQKATQPPPAPTLPEVSDEKGDPHQSAATIVGVPKKPRQAARKKPRPTTKILVVDDDPDWQKTLRGLLVDAGYQVTTAGNEEQAQNLAEQIPFDLAIIDFRLHGNAEYDESGLVLAHVLKKLVPQMKVVLLTGYPPRIDQVAKSFKFFEVEDFIDKSRIYGSEERDLTAIVKKILGTP